MKRSDNNNGRLNLLLSKAVESEDIEKIKRLVTMGADVNSADADGLTPLYHAITKDNLQIAKLLLKNGADAAAGLDLIDTPDQFLPVHEIRTMLHYAIGHKNSRIIMAMIRYGADVNEDDGKGRSALHLLAGHNNFGSRNWKKTTRIVCRIAKCAIDHGADVSGRDKENKTPLEIAFDNCSLSLANLLVRHGARPLKAKVSPLHLFVFKREALREYDPKVLSANINKKDSWGRTPLHWAVYARNVKAITDLIRNGATLDLKDKMGMTPLHYAVTLNLENIARALIREGADVNAKDNRGYIPLHFARQYCSLRFVKHLINSGSDIMARDKDGKTSLHYYKNLSEPLARLLISSGADVNSADRYGKTPLHYVVANSHYLELASLFIECGADKNLKDNEGKTPYRIAVEERQYDIAKFISCTKNEDKEVVFRKNASRSK